MALVLLGSGGCPAGGKGADTNACVPGFGWLDLKAAAGDENAASLFGDLENRMHLVLHHLDEAPDGPMNCDYTSDLELVRTDTHGLDLEKAYPILAGWTCGYSREFVDLEEGYYTCIGQMDWIEVPDCGRVSGTLVVTCEFKPTD